MCLHWGPEINPDNRDDVDEEWVQTRIRQYVAEHFPSLHPEPSIVEPCIYTVCDIIYILSSPFFLQNGQSKVTFTHLPVTVPPIDRIAEYFIYTPSNSHSSYQMVNRMFSLSVVVLRIEFKP
jgi:hypothetical protein